MAALNFPNSPLVNDIHNENGRTYQWNGVSWVSIYVAPLGYTGSAGFTGSQGTTGFVGSQGGDPNATPLVATAFGAL